MFAANSVATSRSGRTYVNMSFNSREVYLVNCTRHTHCGWRHHVKKLALKKFCSNGSKKYTNLLMRTCAYSQRLHSTISALTGKQETNLGAKYEFLTWWCHLYRQKKWTIHVSCLLSTVQSPASCRTHMAQSGCPAVRTRRPLRDQPGTRGEPGLAPRTWPSSACVGQATR